MFSYAPLPAGGDSWGLVSDRFVLVVAGAEDDALRAWATLSDPDAELEDVLQTLAARGMRATPDFALVELVDGPTGSVSVALRGRGVADLGGAPDRHLTGAGAGSWVEAAAQNITGLRLGLDGAPTGDARMPLGRGAVRAGWVHAGLAASPAGTGAGADADADADAPEETIDLFEDATIMSARRHAPASVARLRFPDGATVPLDGTLTLGRSPQTRAGRVHVLRSPHKEVSGTHAAIVADGAALRLQDLGSTNGTTLTLHPSGSRIVLRGAEHPLGIGDLIDFGDGNSAVVETGP